MNSQMIYRFLSFESFVDVIQRKAFLFSHPSRWDDPWEWHDLYILLNSIYKPMDKPYLYFVMNLSTVCSWTTLEESDALWKIYGKGSNCIRISTLRENFEKIGLKVQDVQYSNELCRTDDSLQLFAHKRLPFQHESEARVIKVHKQYNTDDSHREFAAFSAAYLNEKIDVYGFYNSIYFDTPKMGTKPDEKEYQELYKEIIELTNYNLQRNAEYVSFERIPNFITSVMVCPQAENWFVEMVGMFCKNNGLPFIGKSTLYEKR